MLLTPAWYRKVEWASCVLFVCVWLFLFIKIFEYIRPSEILWPVIFGALFADLMSGIVHWFADTWGDENWPVVGPALIRPFREHHIDPESITKHDFIETNGSLLGLAALFGLSQIFSTSPATIIFALSVMFFVALTNQIHKFAHMTRPPRLYQWLSSWGLVMSSKHHKEHHNHGLISRYCITIGICNYICDGVHFFRILEQIITKATKALPRSYDVPVNSYDEPLR